MAHTMKGARSVGDTLERNILSMTAEPTPLLKFGEGGKPGFRPFQLSNDLLALTWHSKTKAADKTRVMIKDMKEIRYGQRTEKFKKNNRSDLENLSFSVMYVERGVSESLDLVCKDEAEFQTWTTTLSTLIEGKTDLTQYLLAIQKRQLAEQGKTDVDSSDAAKRARKQKQLMSKKGDKNEANDVYAFGWGEWGQNGIGQNLQEMESCPNPKLLESLLGKHVVQIAQGWSHTAVLLESGELLQYGNRIGTGLNEDYVMPTPTVINTTGANTAVAARGSVSMSAPQSIVALSCGAFHTAALTERGQVLSWGSSVNGQLGHGDRKDVKADQSRFIEFLRSPGQEVFVVSVVCGSSFTAVLSDEGAVYTFGCGQHGVLGHNDVRDRDLPTRVQDLAGTEIQKIAAGDCHMFACTMRETYAWGWNACSQLGLGSEEDQHRPHVVEVLRGHEIKEIAAGALHTVAIVHVLKMKSDILYSWGSNACGQAGQGKKNKLARPTPVPTNSAVNSPVVEIKCGSFHTLIRTSNGEVLATGSNKYGQCGFVPGAGTKGANTAAAAAAAADVSAVSEQLDEFRIVDSLKDKIARSLCCGGENSSVLTARAWVEDSEATECMACKSAFTFVNRKHHCRNCGGIFCGACSSKKIAILRIQVTEPVRVCVSCYTMLGGR